MLALVTRWLVGMDLRTTSAGALRYAAWLYEQAQHGQAHGRSNVELQAVHVVEQLEQHYAVKLGLHPPTTLLSLTREAAREALHQAGVAACFHDVDAVPGGVADEVLDGLRADRGATALVVGRQGPLREGFPPRLGRVARHLLRHASGPVVVVPPDLEPARLIGPVVLATDLGPSSAAATRFAGERAREWGRPLLVVHVLPPPDVGLTFLPRDAQDGARSSRWQARRDEARRLVEAQGWEGLEVELELPSGTAIDELLAIARRGSPLVVCGARRLSWVARQLRASHATSLSSHAPVPVAVVPPETVANDAQDHTT